MGGQTRMNKALSLRWPTLIDTQMDYDNDILTVFLHAPVCVHAPTY